MASEASTPHATARISFPVHCEYHGGCAALGAHGRHLWIQEGRIGHGEAHLTHSIPLATVDSVEVAARDGGGVPEQTLLAVGIEGLGRFPHPAAVITDVTVRTIDGQEAAWVVHERDVPWVRDRLGGALAAAGVPFYGDLRPNRT